MRRYDLRPVPRSEREHVSERRPDVVLFVNGLPLAVVELKNPTDENATIWSALRQLQTYKTEIPSLFAFNPALMVSDGLEARIGTLTAGREWFKPWRTIGGEMPGVVLPPRSWLLGRPDALFPRAAGQAPRLWS